MRDLEMLIIKCDTAYNASAIIATAANASAINVTMLIMLLVIM